MAAISYERIWQLCASNLQIREGPEKMQKRRGICIIIAGINAKLMLDIQHSTPLMCIGDAQIKTILRPGTNQSTSI